MFRNIKYVPNAKHLRKLIMDEFHKRPYVSHPGYQNMMTIIKRTYFWLGMKKDIV